jgi:hypothetical protein
LKAEKGLLNYLRLLKGLRKRYTIIIAVKDTPGAYLTDEVATRIKALGLAVDLSFEKGLGRRGQHTYIGVIECGQTVCETLSKQKEPSYYTAARGGVSYEVVSKSYPEGNTAIIKIDGIDYATNRRGLNIAVFDPIAKIVIDSVCFDTHIFAFTCYRIEEMIGNRLSQLNAITAGGYSVAQYLIDKNIKSAVIYTEERYWRLVEQLLMQLQISNNGVVRCVSQMPFSKAPPYMSFFTQMNTSKIDISSFTQNDTLIIVKPDTDGEIVKQCGIPCIQLPSMLDEMYRWVFWERPILNFLMRRPNVRLVSFNFPSFPLSGERSENEQRLIDNNIIRENYRNFVKQGLSTSHVEFGYSPEELEVIFKAPPMYYDERGVRVFQDFSSKYVNTVNGHRVTLGCPENPEQTIWVVGGCNVYGVDTPDRGTIASHLQVLCNNGKKRIRVENYGLLSFGHGVDKYKILDSIPVKDGDLVLNFSMTKPVFESFPFADLSAILKRPHNYGEVFTDLGHYNENGHRAIADALFKFLQEHDFFETSLPPPPRRSFLTCRHAAAYVRHTPRPRSRNHSLRQPADTLRQRTRRLQSLPQAN